MRDITLNPEQRLYVIATEGGVTCFGFDNARDHARQIAQRLDRPDLIPTADDAASLPGYEKYLAAVRAWGESAQGHGTYFDPGTDPRLAKVLETCRHKIFHFLSSYRVRLHLQHMIVNSMLIPVAATPHLLNTTMHSLHNSCVIFALAALIHCPSLQN